MALELIEDAKARASTEFLFPGYGKDDAMKSSSVGKAVRRSRAAIGVPHWTAHDLRRTAATGMADLGVAPHVIGHVLNHRAVTQASVADQVYQPIRLRSRKARCTRKMGYAACRNYRWGVGGSRVDREGLMAADRPLDEVLAALALGQNRRFEFTDLQWNAIQASLGTSRLRPVIRLQLEMLVGAFRQHAPALPSTDEKKALQQVGRQAKLLLKKFDHLPGKLAWVLGFSTILTADPPGSERSLSTQQIEEQWAYFRRNLKSLVANSERIRERSPWRSS